MRKNNYVINAVYLIKFMCGRGVTLLKTQNMFK